jgi:hypothetical protein
LRAIDAWPALGDGHRARHGVARARRVFADRGPAARHAGEFEPDSADRAAAAFQAASLLDEPERYRLGDAQ